VAGYLVAQPRHVHVGHVAAAALALKARGAEREPLADLLRGGPRLQQRRRRAALALRDAQRLRAEVVMLWYMQR
jgi:hypothetical protein